MPPQVGQAPKGLLKEKSLGSISGMVKPETGQAKRCEKVILRASAFPVSWPGLTPPSRSAALVASGSPGLAASPRPGDDRGGGSANSTTAVPSASSSAVSSDSDS